MRKRRAASATPSSRAVKRLNPFTTTLPRNGREIFTYTPLRKEKHIIRLLTIDQDQDQSLLPNQPIACTLLEASLDDNPHYHALSYRWAEENAPTRDLFVNGCVLHIAENVYQYLEMAGTKKILHQSALWVDAVCIDQSNSAERGHQVQLMGKIFQNAQRVNLWLPNIVLDQKAFSFFDYDDNLELREIRWNYLPEQTRNIIRADINAIYSASYWNRMWVLQEILLAQEVTVFCKDGIAISGICLDQFVKTLSLIQNDDQQSAFTPYVRPENSLMLPLSSLRRSRDYLRENRIRLLYDLIDQNKRRSCSDPRDKVYALLGLARVSDDFQVDYKASLASVLTEVLRYELTHSSLDVNSFLTLGTILSYSLGLDAHYLSKTIQSPRQSRSSRKLQLTSLHRTRHKLKWYRNQWVLEADTKFEWHDIPVMLCECKACRIPLLKEIVYTVLRMLHMDAFLIISGNQLNDGPISILGLGNYCNWHYKSSGLDDTNGKTYSSAFRTFDEFANLSISHSTVPSPHDAPHIKEYKLNLSDHQVAALIQNIRDSSSPPGHKHQYPWRWKTPCADPETYHTMANSQIAGMKKSVSGPGDYADSITRQSLV